MAKRPLALTDLVGLPYHPLMYHLDLCILGYQLYAQSLVWPFDPYYEKHGNTAARQAFMAQVRAWAGTSDPQHLPTASAIGGYRGPGLLAGFADNPDHDPLLFRYDTLRPWAPELSLAQTTWTQQHTPQPITEQITAVMMSYRPGGGAAQDVVIKPVARAGRAALSQARDQLFAFEGDTGDKGEPGQPASQSLLGFVLQRHINERADYDIHVVFRGARSGSGARAIRQAFSTEAARGNPDWITALGNDFVGVDVAGDISGLGRVHRGFARSMRSLLPKIIGCLARIAANNAGRAPVRIFVTGHSLGGGLAQHFVSAVHLGSQYGPVGQGAAMPSRLKTWPWAQIKLITFGAPFAGDALWARSLTQDQLQSQFSTRLNLGLTRTDPDALAVSQSQIVARLTDPDQPAAYRILDPADPVSTLRGTQGKHVGQTVYVAKANPLGLSEKDAHEPARIRALMRHALADPTLPTSGWHDRDFFELNPGHSDHFDGSPAQFAALMHAIEKFHRDAGDQFDLTRLRADFEVFRSLLLR